MGFCLRHMGARLLGASENVKGKKSLPSAWLAAELGWMRLTTIVDEEALVFRGALDLPTAPELVKKVAKAAAALRKKSIRQACDPKAPGVRTFEAATAELQEKRDPRGLREQVSRLPRTTAEGSPSLPTPRTGKADGERIEMVAG